MFFKIIKAKFYIIKNLIDLICILKNNHHLAHTYFYWDASKVNICLFRNASQIAAKFLHEGEILGEKNNQYTKISHHILHSFYKDANNIHGMFEFLN